MRILLTGGAGFIGSHITKLLIERGDEVVILDNFSKSDEENLTKTSQTGQAIIVKGDVRDENLVLKALVGVDSVIHLASLIEVTESVKNPLSFADNNILGTVSLLEAMRKANVKKILFSSSACVYGESEVLPIKEDAKILPAEPYGASKVAAESFISVYHFLHGFDSLILRYFNPYGPGEKHDPETHAIPNFIKAALDKKPLPVYWKGEQVRDFIYVEDLARAHLEVLNLNGLRVFNVGTEKGIKVIDVLNKLSDILGYKLEIDDLGERPGDVQANYASSSLLKQVTGWQAKIDLDEGLKKTLEWFKAQSDVGSAKTET